MTQRIDEKFINLALNLSRKNIGKTNENPSVGCVIVKNNTIISTGITAKNGRPHAEIEAINYSGLCVACLYFFCQRPSLVTR